MSVKQVCLSGRVSEIHFLQWARQGSSSESIDNYRALVLTHTYSPVTFMVTQVRSELSKLPRAAFHALWKREQNDIRDLQSKNMRVN